jgi:lipoprotein-anchoring transpeptidase ErfK/SrfK
MRLRLLSILAVVFVMCVVMSGCDASSPAKEAALNPPQTATLTPSLTPAPPSMSLPGKVILVDLSQQWLWAYEDGNAVFNTPVTTGQPGLETPAGDFTVLSKITDTWFTSAWPPGSPNYFAPELVHYGLYFHDVGFYIHDASWRHEFGPGTNVPHVDPDGTHKTGSHGCVEVSTSAGAWLYQWAPLGTTIRIIGGTADGA